MQLRGAGGGSAETLLSAARQTSSALSLSTWGTLGLPAASACSTSETLGASRAPAAKPKATGSYYEAAAGTARRYQPVPSEHADALEFLRDEEFLRDGPVRCRSPRPGGLPEQPRRARCGVPPKRVLQQARASDLERAGAQADEDGWADGEPGGGGERAPLLSGRGAPAAAPKGQAAQAARRQLESTSAAALVCLALFVGLLTWRLQTDEAQRLPVVVDFVPLFAMPCLVYLLAVHFAVRYVSREATLARWVVLATGLVFALGLQALSICVFLRASGSVTWSWVAALTPLWATLAFLQLLLCFLAPGFMISRALEHFVFVFVALWASVLSVLLAGLKLDGQVEIGWWAVLLPLGFVLSSRLAARSLGGSYGAALSDAAGLISVANLALKQDGVVELPWAAVLLPVLLVLLRHAAQCSAAAGQGLSAGGAL